MRSMRWMATTMTLATALAAAIAWASEGIDSRTITLSDEQVRPAAVTMSQNDVLEFENDSSHVMKLIFVKPAQQEASGCMTRAILEEIRKAPRTGQAG